MQVMGECGVSHGFDQSVNMPGYMQLVTFYEFGYMCFARLKTL